MLPGPESGELLEGLQMDLCLKCFTSPFFEKRLYGVQAITTMISQIRNAEVLFPFCKFKPSRYQIVQRILFMGQLRLITP